VVNAPEVRRVLESSGKVRAVFQGHHHPGDFQTVAGIAYCTLSAMVTGPVEEGGAYGILEIYANGALRLRGFCGQRSYELPPADAATRPSAGRSSRGEMG